MHIGRILDCLTCFARSGRGSVSVMVASAGTVVALSGLLSFDIARAHLASSRLQTAVDAATLAATRDIDSPTLADDIRMVFDANFPPSYLGSSISAFDVVVNQQNGLVRGISLSVSAEIPSPIAGMIRTAGPDFHSFQAAAVSERRTYGAEIAMVLDNTGSMNGSKIRDLRHAAQSLTDIIFHGDESVPNLYVAVVPYTATVNAGTQHADWLRDLSLNPAEPASMDDYSPTAWKGCVLARPAPYDQTDDPPNVQGFDLQFWPSSIDPVTGEADSYHDRSPNVWPDGSNQVDERQSARNNGYGPNLGCGPPTLPLTASYTEVTQAIADLDAWHRGGTMGNLGLVWGWRVLSPMWAGLWTHSDGTILTTRPVPHGQPLNSKIIVMMTDGDNQWYRDDLTAYGRPDNNSLDGETIDDRMLTSCTDIKNAGILVYTITFGSSVSSSTSDLYSACASEPDDDPRYFGQKYFHAPDRTQLENAFKDIGGQLTELRLVQ